MYCTFCKHYDHTDRFSKPVFAPFATSVNATFLSATATHFVGWGMSRLMPRLLVFFRETLPLPSDGYLAAAFSYAA